MAFSIYTALLLGWLVAAVANAQSSCLASRAPSGNIAPAVASGYVLAVVATGLSAPRGIAFDSAGHLLVVEQGTGVISSHTVSEDNGCVSLTGSTVIVPKGLSLNHGIAVNGSTLYASNPESVYSWTYDATTGNISDQQTIINNMNNSDHSTRTILISTKAPGIIAVSRGSTSNLDIGAASLDTGRSQVKAFNMGNRSGTYDFDSTGLRLAWGVRNEVGLGEHPSTGGIWGVENSADQITRMGADVSNNNPAEELNFFGCLNGTKYANQGGNFGYPWCLSVWGKDELPDNFNLTVGQQFAFDPSPDLNGTNKTDAYCSEQVESRLVFQAHMAPLDIKFNNSGTEAWITFHGSWDTQIPVGYKLSVIQFRDGQPTEPLNSTTAAVDIITNAGTCPQNCFRPVALAFDKLGRLFMSSDASGEIYMITRTAAGNNTTPSGASGTTTSSAASATSSSVAETVYTLTPSHGVAMISLWFLVSFLL